MINNLVRISRGKRLRILSVTEIIVLKLKLFGMQVAFVFFDKLLILALTVG